MDGKEAIRILNSIHISGSNSDVITVAEAVDFATKAIKRRYYSCMECKYEDYSSHEQPCSECQYCLTSKWEQK